LELQRQGWDPSPDVRLTRMEFPDSTIRHRQTGNAGDTKADQGGGWSSPPSRGEQREIAALKVLERNRFYMLTWFGGVVRLPNDDSQLGIQASFSPLRDGVEPGDPVNPALDLEPDGITVITLAVGLVPVLHIGQVYRNRRCIGVPEFVRQEIEGVSMHPDKLHYVTDFGKSPRLQDQTRADLIIPHESFPLVPYAEKSRNGVGARCLAVPVPGRNWKLLFHCVEIVRFYFARSTLLSRAVFNGFPGSGSPNYGDTPPGPLMELYDPARSRKRANGSAVVWLQDGVSPRVSATIARFCFSDYARREALKIHASIRKLAQREKCPSPEAAAPFEGDTNLTVRGIWLGPENTPEQARYFLVFRIERCTAPFPFAALTCVAGRAAESVTDVRPEPGGFGPEIGPTPPRDDGTEPIKQDGQPTNRHHRRFHEVEAGEFADLETKPRRLIRKPKKPGERRRLVGETEEVDGVSTGEGTWDMDSKLDPIEFVDGAPLPPEDKDDPEPPVPVKKDDAPEFQVDFNAFREALRLRDWKVRYCSPASYGDPDAASGAALLPRPPHEGRRNWLYIDHKTGQRRHVLIAEVFVHGIYGYLFEVERRPESTEAYATLSLARAGGEKASDELLTEILKACSAEKGRWENFDLQKDLYRIVIGHPPRPKGTSEEGKDAKERYPALLAEKLSTGLLHLWSVAKGQ
jgi:hypothetical protein